MGMQLRLEQITPSRLEKFLRDPKKFYAVLMSDLSRNPKAAEFMAMVARHRQNLPLDAKANLDRLASMLPKTSPQNASEGLKSLLHKMAEAKREQPQPEERKQFSLEKDWHVLHYALNGTAEGGDGPMGVAVMGGHEIPDPKGVMDYGPVRYLREDEVKAVAVALDSVDPQQLTAKLDQQDAEQKRIYLAHTLDDPIEWKYLPELFGWFRDFYKDAALHGNAMLMEMY